MNYNEKRCYLKVKCTSVAQSLLWDRVVTPNVNKKIMQ